MKPLFEGRGVTLFHADCLTLLRELPDASVDSVVTDPPYGLEFMGKDWDRPWAVSPTSAVGFNGRENNLSLPSHRDSRNANCRSCGGRQRGSNRCLCANPSWDRHPNEDMLAFQTWCTEWTTECLRVLKPGGHLLAFGGSRTWHRLACAIEDAGFEIRDSIAWLYGSGFPKSLDVSKAINKTAGVEYEAKPASGVGFMNATDDGYNTTLNQLTQVGESVPESEAWQGWGTALKPAHEPIVVARKPLVGTVAANVLAYGTGALNIDGCRIGDGTGEAKTVSYPDIRGNDFNNASGSIEYIIIDKGRWPANVMLDESAASMLDESRFFYVAKASKSERPRVDGVAHPTVKPLSLMCWLVRLVTPPNGVVLEPFAGSGTTVEAAIMEGFQVIACEMTDDYLPLILERVNRVEIPAPDLFDGVES